MSEWTIFDDGNFIEAPPKPVGYFMWTPGYKQTITVYKKPNLLRRLMFNLCFDLHYYDL